MRKSAPAKTRKPAGKETPKAAGRAEQAKAAAAASLVEPQDVLRLPPPPSAPAPTATPRLPFRRPQPLTFAGVGRNDICPCGSGKRFKNCHGH